MCCGVWAARKTASNRLGLWELGKILPYRSNIPYLSQFCFGVCDKSFPERRGRGGLRAYQVDLPVRSA